MANKHLITLIEKTFEKPAPKLGVKLECIQTLSKGSHSETIGATQSYKKLEH